MFQELSLNDVLNLTGKNQIDAGECHDLQKQFGSYQCYYCNIQFNQNHFDYWKEIIKKKNRRGEVVLVIRNHMNQILLHTKSFYPDNTYRLLSGGIDQDEPVPRALARELFEETGFNSIAQNMVAFLFYRFSFQDQFLAFPSFIFEIEPDGSEPQSQDQEEEITNYKWIPYSYLDKVAAHLKSFENEWRDWGRMRAVVHDIVYQWYL